MQRLRMTRLKQKKSQFQLSLESGVWPSKISNIENGRWNPSKEEMEKLAKALGVKVTWLFPKGDTKNESDYS